MWYLVHSTTQDKISETGDVVVLLSSISIIDIIKKEDIELYKIIIITADGKFYELHDSLQVAKERALNILNLIGGDAMENKKIIDNFDIKAGTTLDKKDTERMSFLKAMLA